MSRSGPEPLPVLSTLTLTEPQTIWSPQPSSFRLANLSLLKSRKLRAPPVLFMLLRDRWEDDASGSGLGVGDRAKARVLEGVWDSRDQKS